jgi:hypothetical protein
MIVEARQSDVFISVGEVFRCAEDCTRQSLRLFVPVETVECLDIVIHDPMPFGTLPDAFVPHPISRGDATLPEIRERQCGDFFSFHHLRVFPELLRLDHKGVWHAHAIQSAAG